MVCSKEAHLLRACHLNSSSSRSNRVAKRADLLPPLLNKAASTVHPVALPAMRRLLSGKFAPHQFTHPPIHCPFLRLRHIIMTSSSPAFRHTRNILEWVRISCTPSRHNRPIVSIVTPPHSILLASHHTRVTFLSFRLHNHRFDISLTTLNLGWENLSPGSTKTSSAPSGSAWERV